jgi:L-alanine-DL-glutamate epimerase-like enolase superfamily enzyme
VSRIQDVRVDRLTVPLHTPFVTALRRTTVTETVVVRVSDSDGVTGWGEAPQVWQVTGESLAGAEACITGPLAAVILHQDCDDVVPTTRAIASAVAGNFGAKAAVDVALHDLAARRRGVSLPVFLGSTQLSVPTDMTLSADDADSIAVAAGERAAQGFNVLKMKVGTDAATDVARVRAVREAVGPSTRIRLDANQGWTAREAVGVIRGLEDAGLDVELVEQPVPAGDLEGLAWVTSHVSTPVMADESVFGIRDLVAVIRSRAADMVNVKLAKCGGISTARTLLELARAQGMGTMVGSMMESHVGVGAAASVVAAYGTTAVADLDAAWWAASPPILGGMRYDGPLVVLPDEPGLGIEDIVR